MLSLLARKALGQVMWIGCGCMFFPFSWDASTRRLSPLISRAHRAAFHVNGVVQIVMCCFSLLRLVAGLSDATMPPRIRVLNLLWILAYVHGVQGFLELKYRQSGILSFANALFQYIDNTCEGSQSARWGGKKDCISALVVISYALLLASPAIHGLMLVGSPCAPHFMSSLYLDCAHAGHDVGTFLEKLLFFCLENYFVAVFFFLLAMNWFIVFLALAWLRAELRTIEASLNGVEEVRVGVVEGVGLKYRQLQVVAVNLNESFRLYLEWAPSIFMAHVALLLFASFRYWNEDVVSYVMFPLCAARCMLDALTPLALAGDVSWECDKVLRKWKQRQAKGTKSRGMQAWLTRFFLSCAQISCKAGSLYTLQNSIVPVNINNLALCTLNLLVAYPHQATPLQEFI